MAILGAGDVQTRWHIVHHRVSVACRFETLLRRAQSCSGLLGAIQYFQGNINGEFVPIQFLLATCSRVCTKELAQVMIGKERLVWVSRSLVEHSDVPARRDLVKRNLL